MTADEIARPLALIIVGVVVIVAGILLRRGTWFADSVERDLREMTEPSVRGKKH
jgi:hypothetical protein